jgi:hypothetical protein
VISKIAKMSRSAIIAFPILSLLCLHAPFSHGERIKLFRPCVGYGYLSLRADRITARMGAFAMDNELVEATTLVKDDIKCSSYDGDGKSVEVKAILHFNTTHPGVSFVLLGDFRVGKVWQCCWWLSMNEGMFQALPMMITAGTPPP